MTRSRSLFAFTLGLAVVVTTVAHAETPASTDMPASTELATLPAPDAAEPATATEEVAQVMARIERWGGSFNGCMNGATPEERAMAASLEYTCACLATYIVNLCAPTDATTNDQVMACFGVNEMAVQNAFNRCLTYGSLQVAP